MNITKTLLAGMAAALGVTTVTATPDTTHTEDRTPFAGYDLSWVNGQNRQTDFPLSLKDKEGNSVVTGVALVDGYYNYDFSKPIDNTHISSASIGRTNEFTLNMVSVGLEANYKNAIGRMWLQYGQMSSIVQELDGTTGHGRNTSISNLKYIREAAAGYHFNKWYGINVEMGIFMSYIGLESYVINENWCYQRSMVSDFTPFYFSGARLQLFPSRKVKQEIWLMNGWQSYNSWNQGIGFGSSTCWRPNTNLQLVANFYIAGQDTRNAPDVRRYHHDNSIVARYYNNRAARGITQAAFSINNHYGFQTGNGVLAAQNNMMGTSIANRIWFCKNMYAVTLRGDYITNPGAYLAFTPSPVAANDYNDAIAAGETLSITQATATFDVMPNDFFTFRIEYGYRGASVPYFAGRGGTTSPDGWIDTPAGTWRPDLVKTESRLTAAVSFRL